MSKHNHNTGSPGKTNPAPEGDKGPESNLGSARNSGSKPREQAAETPSEGIKASVNSENPGAEKAEAANTQDQTIKNEKTPEEKIADLEAQLAEANDQYLRKAADFENFRKRMNREKQDAIDFANQSLLMDLIQTMDDFERAIKSAESLDLDPAARAFLEGITMIEKRLNTQLENKWGLKRFSSVGEPFDPNIHEAMQMERSPEVTDPVVKEEYYKGYTLKDRVIRSAKVKVLMPVPGSGQDTEKPESTEKPEAKNAGANQDS